MAPPDNILEIVHDCHKTNEADKHKFKVKQIRKKVECDEAKASFALVNSDLKDTRYGEDMKNFIMERNF